MPNSRSLLSPFLTTLIVLFRFDMATKKQLLLSAILANIEVTGDVENGKPTVRSQYSVRLYVDDKEVAKSTHPEPRSLVLKWEWNVDNQIWFEPSSMMKIMLYRGFGTNINLLNHLVGQHEGKVADLLENNTSFDLKDKKGSLVPAKMKMVLLGLSSSIDDSDIKEFLEKVDVDVLRVASNDAVTSTVSTLGQVLKLTKAIMDKLSQVHPILNASWTVVSSLYEVVQETDLQDESIRELASVLREMLGTANAIPELPVIPNTTDVIEAISRQSLQVASLIHEYTRLAWAGRTVKIQLPGDLKSRIEECRNSCAALKTKLSDRINFDTNIRVKRIEDSQLADKIDRWLSPPDSSRNRNEAHGKRQVDTCSWFLDSDRFCRWQENAGFLWVKGKAGCGKSILCSSIIDKLPEPDPSLGIAYFFFDGRDSQTELQLHNKLIRSLISQFSDTRHGGIPEELVNLYKKCGVQQPLDDQLHDTLRAILVGFSHAYIVIDALDECNDCEMTLNWVNKLVADPDRKAENLHILVTSRPLRHIEKVFKRLDSHPIDVDETAANWDIIKYLKLQMELKFTEYDENTRAEIETRLSERAEGSFRWVALQLAELENCLSKHEITQQLGNLPKDLEDIYKRMLQEIDKKYRGDTMTFLQWLAFARRPMKVAEVAEAITVDLNSEEGPVFNPEKRYKNPQDVLARCSSLVIESEGTVKLSHFSVKEYLLSAGVEKDFAINEEASHSKIAQISVAYLLQPELDSFVLTNAILNFLPLARYAAEHWIDHAKSGGMDDAVLKLILRLFIADTAPLTNWIRMWDIDQVAFFRRKKLSIERGEVHSPLYYASVAGMEEVADCLLQRGENVNAEGGKHGNALQAASGRGHEAIVKLLLKKGADVNAQCGSFGNALQAASFQGSETIVKLLLEKGAEVNAQGGTYWTALQAASGEGDEAIVKLLLENGAEVNAEGGHHGDALQAASFQGSEAIVKLLLGKGAEVRQRGNGGTALQAASKGGQEVIVKLLLENGAEVNAQGGYYWTALQAASGDGHEAIVKLLLENGAEVNAQGGSYWTALQAASGEGHEEIVKLLLENEAEVNTQGGESGNALQAASGKGHKAIVKLLLENGAEVNAQGGYYGNALQAASNAQGDHEETVKLLLENGAEVNAQGGHYGNALQAASDRSSEVVVQLLLENKAEVNAQGGYYGYALQAASNAQGDHKATVKLLLENGAEVNAQGGYYGNALQAASDRRSEVVVQLLLENGAEVNAQGGHYGNALQAASSQGSEAIVKLLLEKGAEVNAQGGDYGNALQAASGAGHKAIVKLLLENGADVNAQGGRFGNALEAASSKGDTEIGKLLLENGAEGSASFPDRSDSPVCIIA